MAFGGLPLTQDTQITITVGVAVVLVTIGITAGRLWQKFRDDREFVVDGLKVVTKRIDKTDGRVDKVEDAMIALKTIAERCERDRERGAK